MLAHYTVTYRAKLHKLIILEAHSLRQWLIIQTSNKSVSERHVENCSIISSVLMKESCKTSACVPNGWKVRLNFPEPSEVDTRLITSPFIVKL